MALALGNDRFIVNGNGRLNAKQTQLAIKAFAGTARSCGCG